MKYRKWVKHIIRRFGKENTYKFAESAEKCPCSYLNWKCDRCKYNIYNRIFVGGCEVSNQYADDSINKFGFIPTLKRKILKKLKVGD